MAESAGTPGVAGSDHLAAYVSVPAARAARHFITETIGSEAVLYDSERIQYHTLSETAFAVWRPCDGVRTAASIAAELDLLVETVELAIAELGEAGLLEAPQETFDSGIQRRKLLKLAGAGIVGAVVLPVVLSITAPTSMSAQTCTKGPCRNNGNCNGSGSVCGDGANTCVNGCCVCN